MRMEFCEDRLRRTDLQYINKHLNSPGTRYYRKVWKMVAWHTKIGENQQEQWVLDRLTDAQKRANTTRGSTPGLIDLALPDTLENRVPMPVKGRWHRIAMVDEDNAEDGQLPQIAPDSQVPQVNQDARTARIDQIPQTSPLSSGYQDEQSSQSPSAGSPGIATALSPLATGPRSQEFVRKAVEPVFDDSSRKVQAR